MKINRFEVLSIIPQKGYIGEVEYIKVGSIREEDGVLQLGIERAVEKTSTVFVSGTLNIRGKITEERTDGWGYHVTAEIGDVVSRTVWQRGFDKTWGEVIIPCDLAKAQLPEGLMFYSPPPADFAI